MILDSPDVPQVDLFSEAIIGSRYAMRELSAACRAAPNCRRAFPDLERTFATISSSWARRRPGSRLARGSSRSWTARSSASFDSCSPPAPRTSGRWRPPLDHRLDTGRGIACVGNRRWRDRGSRPAGTEPDGHAGPGVRPAAFSDGTFYWFFATTNCRSSIGGRSENWPEASRGTRTRTSTARISTRASGGRGARDPHELVTSISPR